MAGDKIFEGTCVETERVEHRVDITIYFLNLARDARLRHCSGIVIVGDKSVELKYRLDWPFELGADARVLIIGQIFGCVFGLLGLGSLRTRACREP